MHKGKTMEGGKNLKVEAGDKEAAIEICIVVEYGCKFHEVAKVIQNKVQELK